MINYSFILLGVRFLLFYSVLCVFLFIKMLKKMSQRYDFFLSFSSFVFQYFYFLLLLIDNVMFCFVTMSLVIMSCFI